MTKLLETESDETQVVSDTDSKQIQLAAKSQWSRPMTAEELFAHNSVVLGKTDGET
jgi:hypothetical protein